MSRALRIEFEDALYHLRVHSYIANPTGDMFFRASR
jgi:hypothetical protein